MTLFARGKRSDSSSGDEVNPTTDSTDPEVVSFIPPAVPSGSSKMGMNPSKIASSASEFITVENVGKTLKVIKMLREGNVAGAASEVGMETVGKLIEQFQDAGFDVGIDVLKPKGPNQPDGGGPVEFGEFNNSYANATMLSLDPDPTEIRLNTGIKPDTFTPDYQIAEATYASPLHISLVRFSFPAPSGTNLAGNFFDNSVMFDLRNKIQRNITYSLPANVTTTNLTGALNALINALSVYYSVSRLLVYGNNAMNKNEALLHLRGTVDASVGDNFLRLKRMLEGIPIPPNLNTLIYYLHQIYLSSSLPGSPAIIFSPIGFTNGVPNWSELTSAIDGLNNSINADMYAIIGRAIPSWYGTKLYTGVSNPLHDPNFTTIWTNAPYWYTNAGSSVNNLGPQVTGYDVSIRYNSWTNNLDGGAFALTSMWNTGTSAWIPSLLVPFRGTVVGSTDNTSRISWFNIGGTAGFYSSSAADELSFGRDETNTTSFRFGNLTSIILQFGSERCWSVTPRVVVNTVYQLMDWCLSWDTIPTRVDRSLESGSGPLKAGPTKYSDNNSSNRRGPRRRRKSNKGKGG